MSPEGQLTSIEPPTPASRAGAPATAFSIIGVLSFSHLLNDMIQSLIPALYPMLKTSLDLSFAQVGLITLSFQMTASILQPAVGMYADRRPMFYSLAAGMGLTLIGLLLLSRAGSFPAVMISAALI